MDLRIVPGNLAHMKWIIHMTPNHVMRRSQTSAAKGRSLPSPLGVLSGFGSAAMWDGERCSMVTCLAPPATIAGNRVMAVAPLPMMTTFLSV